jgi:hypothetical protein
MRICSLALALCLACGCSSSSSSNDTGRQSDRPGGGDAAGRDSRAEGTKPGGDSGPGVTCKPGERKITLVNSCGKTTIYAGWSGNKGDRKPCSKDSECPGSSCDKVATPHRCAKVEYSCSSAKDCPAVNEFCNTQIADHSLDTCKTDADCTAIKASYHCDLSDPLPHTADTCTVDSDCQSSAKNPALGPKAWCDTATGTCAFHHCAWNSCFSAPVPVAVPSNAKTCTSPAGCTDPGQFCYVPLGDGDQTKSGWCVDVPKDANHATLAPQQSKAICLPTPWAGRFWPRTNCVAGSEFKCDTGSCLGQSGKFAEACAQSGTDSPTVAEFFFPPWDGTSEDYYDVSMVDGATIAVQITADQTNIDLSKPSAVGESCTDSAACASKHDGAWACDTTKLKQCVLKFRCASPGCVSGCEAYGFGRTLGADHNCTWKSDFALAEADCPAELRATNASAQYVGCKSPKDVCTGSSPPAALSCSTLQTLYECTGAHEDSCYTDPKNYRHAADQCCGCPSWTPEFCQGKGNSTDWQTASTKYYSKFHAACPTAYVFPFDDKNSTFTCLSKTAEANVDYTITFCPK